MTIDIEKLFTLAHEKKASDLHLLVGQPPILRITDDLVPIEGAPEVTDAHMQTIFKKLLTPDQMSVFMEKKDLDISYGISDGTRFRVNLHMAQNHYGLVARVIPQEIPSMQDIQMPEIATKLINEEQGLVIVTGPTGSGKSTTLASMVETINQEKGVSIITLEDPIEFLHKPQKSIIMQRQLGTDMTSFAAGLKHVLRQDPDVILVGEMRDLETIATTITLAETGHLVFATLHTLNAAQTIDRIIDVFPSHQQPQVRLQLSMSLKAVISQKLLPHKSDGLVAAREIMINTPAIANLIRENKIAQIKTVIQTSADEGMVTMDQDLKRLVEEGLIDKKTAHAHMLNPESLK
ncbi:MAG: type IV pilus twitching motility protein PilT [Patescibacteria group bacterium]